MVKSVNGIRKIGVVVFFILLLTGCVSVKPYQKAYLNDEDMQLTQGKVAGVESGFQSYREGSSGAESGKIGGGCGCN